MTESHRGALFRGIGGGIFVGVVCAALAIAGFFWGIDRWEERRRRSEARDSPSQLVMVEVSLRGRFDVSVSSYGEVLTYRDCRLLGRASMVEEERAALGPLVEKWLVLELRDGRRAFVESRTILGVAQSPRT